MEQPDNSAAIEPDEAAEGDVMSDNDREPLTRVPQLLPSTFIRYLVRTVEKLHADRPRTLHTIARGRLAQFWYGTDRKVHYEVWLHERSAQLEIGLHLEAAPDFNQRLYRELDRHLVEIQAELGPAFWLEEWDHGWVRLYETHPLRPLDLDRIEEVADRLLSVIDALDPIYRAITGRGARGKKQEGGDDHDLEQRWRLGA